ncbi:MAG: hypothetical protein U5R31_08870 [Acidimicrobiia bacterium]|nr:hypothetical protein [Acidimicrobiia bacterium]
MPIEVESPMWTTAGHGPWSGRVVVVVVGRLVVVVDGSTATDVEVPDPSPDASADAPPFPSPARAEHQQAGEEERQHRCTRRLTSRSHLLQSRPMSASLDASRSGSRPKVQRMGAGPLDI